MQQHTLQKPVSHEGVGLHSGNAVRMTLLPAPAKSGIRFRRLDLEGQPEVEANVENVTETNRSTTLAKGSVKVHTVEHVLAALAGSGVDNAVIGLDANEPPISDGSARLFCRLIADAGLSPQAEAREPFRLTDPIEVQLGDSLVSAFPHDTFKITCTSSDSRGRFTQLYSLEVTPKSWEQQLAHARTFCFFEEIEYLIKNNLIRGGSLENAVIIRDDVVLTNEPLRYPEEFVRHKMLDIIGDLSLVGRPVNAHIVAVKPSHAANCELARRIQQQWRRPLAAAQSFAPPPFPVIEGKAGAAGDIVVTDGTVLDSAQVMKILPHRFPFLMIDKVTKIDGDKLTAIKNVSINEPYFQGHFPGHPIMPGVLQLEAIAQAAGILTLRQAGNWGKIAYFMAAEAVKWRKPVRPGDTLVINVELTKTRGKVGRAKGICQVDGDVVSEAEVMFILMDS